MSISTAILLFFAGVFILFIFLGISIYNGLVSLKQQVGRAWANIDVILKQRHDEIPQLVQIIEQFTQYERGTIDRLVNARKAYGTAHSIGEKIEASKETSSALRGILAIGEGYPELKSNANFVQLQTRISGLESNIADRRENYNDSVTNFNTRILQIPDTFFASLLGYQALSLFTIDKKDTEMPNLKINLPS